MSIAAVSLLVLVAVFVTGTVWPISIGVAAFAATFVVGVVLADMPTDEVFALFPSDLFVLLAGITYLFAVAQRNGTMAVITRAAVRFVRGWVAIIPWIFFVFAIAFSAIGAGPAAATAVLAPLALGVAQRARISLLLVGVLVVHGSHAGSMSPISPIGAFVNAAAADAGLPDSSGSLFVDALSFNVAVALVAYFLLGGIGLLRRGHEQVEADSNPAASPTGDDAPERATLRHVATFAGIGLLVVLGIGFRFDIGLSAFAIGLLLTLMSPREDARAIAGMPWSTILMLGGIITYIGVVSEVGGIALISDALLGLGSPVLAILLIALTGAITSLFSSTGATLGALIPMLGAVLGPGSAVPASGAVSTLAISSGVVDSSPFSMQGAVLVANIGDDQRAVFFRRLLGWGVSMVVVGCLVPLLLFVLLPMWLG